MFYFNWFPDRLEVRFLLFRILAFFNGQQSGNMFKKVALPFKKRLNLTCI